MALLPLQSFCCNLFSPAEFLSENSLSNVLIVRHAASRTILPLTPRAVKKCVHSDDPSSTFAASETRKFGIGLLKELSMERDTFGNDLVRVVDLCTEVLGEFLHNEYEGTGTLTIETFTDLMVMLNEENLPGAVLATRASILWAQNNVDRDWEDWNSKFSRNLVS